MKHVHWLLPFDAQDHSVLALSNLASVRLRAATILAGKAEKSFSISFGERFPAAQMIVVGKVGPDQNSRHAIWLRYLAEQRELGAKIIIDYTDDHLRVASAMSEFYKAARLYATSYVVPSAYLQKSLIESGCLSVMLIPDILESPVIIPKQTVGSPLSLLWFGHPSNIVFLIRLIERRPDVFRQTRLFLVTDRNGFAIFSQFQRQFPFQIDYVFQEWSPKKLVEVSRLSDLCIIPSDVNSDRKAGASSNRLITALALGLPTAATVLQSYHDFQPYFANIETGEFDELIQSPIAWSRRFTDEQRGIVAPFDQETVSAAWVNHFNALLT